MTGFIETKIAWFRDRNRDLGHRRRALLEAIREQKGVVGTYAVIVNPNPRDQKFAGDYLAALRRVEQELSGEATQCGFAPTEDEEIYWDMYHAITQEMAGRPTEAVDLPSLYREFKDKYFGDSIPEVSENFICKFTKLPFDVSGASYLESDAARIGVKRGIRINEKLAEFPAESKVALLHEMIHATGIRKHNDEFKRALIELLGKGAYVDPLIL
jgi:hypothetical protein